MIVLILFGKHMITALLDLVVVLQLLMLLEMPSKQLKVPGRDGQIVIIAEYLELSVMWGGKDEEPTFSGYSGYTPCLV